MSTGQLNEKTQTVFMQGRLTPRSALSHFLTGSPRCPSHTSSDGRRLGLLPKVISKSDMRLKPRQDTSMALLLATAHDAHTQIRSRQIPRTAYKGICPFWGHRLSNMLTLGFAGAV